jgi:hypothetical protein
MESTTYVQEVSNLWGNVLPALAISLLALGVLARDGVWILAGFAVAATAASVVWGVVFSMLKAGAYFLAQAW